MTAEVIQGIMIPFLGTALGSACVLLMKDRFSKAVERALTGFAAGVMVAIIRIIAVWICAIR